MDISKGKANVAAMFVTVGDCDVGVLVWGYSLDEWGYSSSECRFLSMTTVGAVRTAPSEGGQSDTVPTPFPFRREPHRGATSRPRDKGRGGGSQLGFGGGTFTVGAQLTHALPATSHKPLLPASCRPWQGLVWRWWGGKVVLCSNTPLIQICTVAYL